MSNQHGILSQQAIKRLQGGELIQNGYNNDEIADIVRVTTSAVRKWRRKLKDNNDDIHCLCRKQGSCPTSLLNEQQKQQLKNILLKGGLAAV